MTTTATTTTQDVLQDKQLFPDFAYGPLTEYREKATMDYRKLKLAIKGEELLRLQVSDLIIA